MLGAALGLGREADTGRHTAHALAGTADDVTAPQVDEPRQGGRKARAHVGHSGADHVRPTALLGQADASPAIATAGTPATVTAAQTYPTPIDAVKRHKLRPRPSRPPPSPGR